MLNIDCLESISDLEKCTNLNIILFFTASWCGPCKKVYPKIEELISNVKYNDIKFYKVDVDECEDKLCDDYNINCMPTFIFLKDKRRLDAHSGCDTDILESKILSNFFNIEDDCDDISDKLCE